MPYEVFEAQVFAMQVAGSETSATTLMFALWLLARNPDRQERLRDELRTAVEHADADGQIPFEAVHDLRYLDMVFKGGLLPLRHRVSRRFHVGAGLMSHAIAVPS